MTDIEKNIDIVYEDNHLIVINKRTGIIVQEDATGDKPLVEMVRDYIREKYKKPGNVFTGLVHRIDRPVSGLVIFSKTSKGLERMTELFKNKEIKKIYWAVVKNLPAEPVGKLCHWLLKDRENNIVTLFNEQVSLASYAELSYRVIYSFSPYYLMEVNLVTGKPHQIRAQLASIGCPIRGDKKYGFSSANRDKSINLHAKRIEFIHPVKKTSIVVEAPLPDTDFWRQLKEFEQLQSANQHEIMKEITT